MSRDLPSGTVTFLFTDIEGSTKLLHELGEARYAEALAEHRWILREAFSAHGGVEVDTQGDAFFFAFPTAPGALQAAAAAWEGLRTGPIRVRIGVHTGTPHITDEGYVGADVHRAARIAAVGYGGQVLVSAATATLAGTDGLRDLGEHRLKDLSAPERIYQLGDGDFPPLKSLHQTNLPVPATPFLRREREVGEVTALLERDDVRLVTLTGPGGTGKTRLALQAAGAAADTFAAGVWWAPLAPLRDPALVIEAAAQALGVSGDVAEHIGDKRLLLLFDNFEHVIVAAPTISELLHRCPRLTVLVTSREPLRLDGEWEYAVDPLREHEALELFESRARAARRDFAVTGEVREICARLDNLPLAIELAAARVKVLSPAALLERLERRLPVLAGGTRDAPERQRTLRATIEWSHDLLTGDEQQLFARLSVFAGGCALEAAEEVCDADLDTLASLVDKSLLRQTNDRFWMLETIREYAVERLETSGEAEQVRRRHAEHFLALAEEAEPTLLANPRESLDRLETDHDNIRAALDWLQATGETQLALRLAGAVSRFWYLRGHAAEAWRRLEGLLRADERPTAARGKALSAASMFAIEGGGGDVATARLRAEQALALHQQLGDVWGVAYSEFALAGAVAEQGDMAAARDFFEQSVQAFRALGDEHFALVASRALAWAHEELGEVEQSLALHEDNLRRARALGNTRMQARSLGSMGAIMGEQGRIHDSVAMLSEAYGMDREIGDRLEIALDLSRLASTLAVDGRAVTAAQLLSLSEALREEMGASFPGWAARRNEQVLNMLRAQLDESALAEAWERGRKLTPDAAVALALGHEESQPN
jgi:predicted ATPase